MSYLFGPVPSRRLGLSLGVDILPAKTCNMNCIYCEIGPSKKTHCRAPSVPDADEILKEIERFSSDPRRNFDCLTYTASGEPTLHKHLDKLILEGKRITGKPTAVLTNSSMVSSSNVRKTLCLADIVLPSLDAATQEIFRKINRPHAGLDINSIIEGLASLRREMIGQMWLEILFVKGINDTESEINALKEAVKKIDPHKIQLNTVARPPAEAWARPLSQKKMEEIRSFFGERAEVVIDFKSQMNCQSGLILESEILDTLKRRPLSVEDFKELFGRYERTQKVLSTLLEKGVIREKEVEGRIFYAALENQH